MDFNKLAQEINQINQEKGWNDIDRRPLEIIALIHSEISEATEQALPPAKEVWYNNDGKPEGYTVEIIDAFIRALGYLGLKGFDLSDYFDGLKAYPIKNRDIFEYHAMLHYLLSGATEEYRISGENGTFLRFLAEFAETIYFYYASVYMADHFWYVFDKKIEYNKTRPYRHGNMEA